MRIWRWIDGVVMAVLLLAALPVFAEPSCAERVKTLTTIQQRLDKIREDIQKQEWNLKDWQTHLDEVRKYASLLHTGQAQNIPPKYFADGCEPAVKKDGTIDEKVAGHCIAFDLEFHLDGVKGAKEALTFLADAEKTASTELFQTRDILTAAGCAFEMPKPRVAIKPAGGTEEESKVYPDYKPGDAMRELFGNEESRPPMTDFPWMLNVLIEISPDAARKFPKIRKKPPQPITLFLGKWTGTVTLLASNTGQSGISQPYTLEIAEDGSGISLRSQAGPIGKGGGYKVKVDGNHLRVDYSGPPPTTAVPGATATLTYWLDVTVKGDKMTGQTYTQSDSSYRGHIAQMWMKLSVDLHR